LLVLLLLAGIAAGIWALLGQARVTVPNEVGKQETAATVDLDRRGFNVDVRRRESPEQVGQVIGQSPEAGTKVDKGSTVTLQVSRGPGRVDVPLVAGLSLARATKVLNRRGLRVDSTSEHSASVPKGEVIRSSPPDGTSVRKGSRVRLVVSSGPEQVKVPGVIGLGAGEAHAALRNAGLDFVDTEENSTAPLGTVIAQTPAAGSTVNKGTTVSLTISKGPATVAVPDVGGKTQAQASSDIRSAGFNVLVRSKSVTRKSQDGTVVHQTPAPGRQLTRGRTIIIYIGHFQQPAPSTPPTSTAPQPTTTTP
jgi:serine/threonine-protein kinase